MYKRKFENWNLDCKNVRQSVAVEAYLQSSQEGVAPGGVFVVQGRQFSSDKIQKYRQRREKDLLRSRARRGLANRSPPLSPPSHEIALPDDLRTAHELGIMLVHYIDGSFQAGTWNIGTCRGEFRSNKKRMRTPTHQNFYNTFADGLDLFLLGQHKVKKAAFRQISQALEVLQQTLLEEPPGLVTDLLTLMSRCRRSDRDEIGAMLADYTHKLSSCVLGAGHPISRISATLPAIVSPAHPELLQMVIEICRSKWAEHLLIQNPAAHLANCRFLGFIMYHLDLQREHEWLLRGLLDTPGVAEQIKQYFELQTDLAECLLLQGRRAEALELIRAVLNHAWAARLSNSCQLEILRVAGRCEQAAGSPETARTLLWEAVTWAESHWGETDSDTLYALDLYVQFHPDDAAAGSILEQRCRSLEEEMAALTLA